MSLQFSVVSILPAPTATAPNRAQHALRMQGASDTASILPGTPAWGVPFFSSATVSVPGLGLESFLRQDTESQVQVASRLMCASGTGSFDPRLGKCGSFAITGRAYGARDVASRLECVFANGLQCDRAGIQRVAAGGGAVEHSPPTTCDLQGSITHYNVPLSLFSYLFNGTSSLLPVAFLTVGSAGGAGSPQSSIDDSVNSQRA